MSDNTNVIKSEISGSNAIKIHKTVNELIKLCQNNENFFKSDKTVVGSRIQAAFEKFQEHLSSSIPVIQEIESFAHTYDYDAKTPGNGYRSFILIYESALEYSLRVFNYITANRGSLLFRKSVYLKEMEVCAQMIESLHSICVDLIKMHKNSDDGNLYSKEYSHDNLITRSVKSLNMTCFYGRAIGFQFTESLRPILRYIMISLACFSESYFSNTYTFMKTTNYFLKQPTYFMDPELCARRIINVSMNADVKFCRAFWALAENKLMKALPQLVGYKVDVNKVFKISPEPLQIFSKSLNKLVDIPIPHSHIGKRPISCRLLSARRRKGMFGERLSESNIAEQSKYLIIHSHGGGWIANSSKSHEFYLREWAVKLDIPLLSIDYALAPKAPFPRGLEDVFYTYCWALQNHELLGTTGENIILVGDSAGANLNTSCVIKAIEYGVSLPKGLFCLYSPFLVNFAQTPARFLCCVDPLLPYGFIMRIFKCYGASKPFDDPERTVSDKDSSSNHELITDVRDDNDSETLLSPDSSKSLEAMWLKVKTSSETPDWQSNLNSIEESSCEGAVSPMIYRSDSIAEPCINDDDDDDILRMKISAKNESGEAKSVDLLSCETRNDESGSSSTHSRTRLSSRTPSEENIVVDTIKEVFDIQGLQEKVQSAVSSVKNIITKNAADTEDSEKNGNASLKRNNAFVSSSDDRACSNVPVAPNDEFVFSVPRNYLMSPYLAPDNILKQFPKTHVLTTKLDPCIDDCIEFAKKLRSLSVNVQLDILDSLNHGFLNFSNINKDCHDASVRCMEIIAELLGMDKEVE